MSALFRSSMIAAVMISSAGLYGSEAMKKSSEQVEVAYPGSVLSAQEFGSPSSSSSSAQNTPQSTPGSSPQTSPRLDPSPRAMSSMPGCPPFIDDMYLALLAKKADQEKR